MRKFATVYMRGGTSKGCFFQEKDFPADKEARNKILLQVMGNPDPKQIDGMGGTVSSNNKVVVVAPSKREGIDIDYEVAQVVPGKPQVDWKSNCGNMTSAVGPYAVEMGMVPVVEPITTVHLFNKNTNKCIDVTVPIDPETHTFAQDGDCHIAGIDGTAAELKVKFLYPAGAKTGKLLPTGNVVDVLDIPGVGKIEASILDVSNPMVLVRAKDVGATGVEMPGDVNSNKELCDKLEAIRGTAACMMGLAKDLKDASENSSGAPKIAFVTAPKSYKEIGGMDVKAEDMDVCVRVISVFKCHKASPLTSACAIAVAAALKGSIVNEVIGDADTANVRIGHPSGIMTMCPEVEVKDGAVVVPAVAVQRTARRIMDGTIYIRD